VAGSVTGAEDPGDPTRGLFREQVSYFWQLYLPRLPWMNDQFSYAPFWDTFFHGFVGQFGWLDYDFPGWVYRWAKWVLGLIAALAVIQLILMRGRLRHRIDELVAYVAIMLGLLALIAVAGYQAKLDDYQYVYEQARYLLPLLPLYGAVVAIAVRCGGRRWGPVLAAAVVVIAAVHGLGGFVATIDRYYL
jgi:hypothetical protein